LPSEGKGHTFESCRVRHFIIDDSNFPPAHLLPSAVR